MIFLKINTNIASPEFAIASGIYDRTQFLDIIGKAPDAEIFYSLDGSFPEKKYYEEIAIRFTCLVKAIVVINNECSEVAEVHFEIKKPLPVKGSIMVIGGAEHCQELHQKFVELAGGVNSTKIAFIPASSSEPYASGIDREVRFHDLCGLNIDIEKVPLVNGKRDFTSLKDESNFWILPLAYKDDEFKTDHSVNDPDTVLTDESSFPALDESGWINNGHDKKIAEKLRDGGYDAIFLTGGNQARYMECLTYPDGSDTPVLAMIREIYEERGGVIAGTSAGGAVLSNIMMLGGGSYGAMLEGVVYEDIDVVHYEDEHTPFKSLTDNRVWLGKGFGMLPSCFITDTHFVVRGRIGRLITACLHLKDKTGKNMIGIGSDEDTATIILPDGTGEVIGALGAVLVDVSKAVIMEGNAETGKIYAKNIILHYLESGDKFTYNSESGEVKLTSVSASKTKIEEPAFTDGHNFFFETDVFGKRKLVRCMGDFLTDNNSPDSIAFEMIDNLEDSYDQILLKDVSEAGSVFFRFRKDKNTIGYKGSVTYNWWGRGEKHYPDLITETEENRYSVTNVFVDVLPVSFKNIPDFKDCEHVDLKGDYLKDGYTEEEWYDVFDSRKLFKFGMILIPLENSQVEVRTFFFDYAYNDYDGDGSYSPPRLKDDRHSGGFKDYDIAEMDEAMDAVIFVNSNQAGITDNFGKTVITLIPGENSIKATFEGSKEYSVSFSISDSLKEAVVVFEE